MRNKNLRMDPKYWVVKKYLESRPNLKVRIKKAASLKLQAPRNKHNQKV